MNKLQIDTPKGWRIGQTIFNFLWWLHQEKKFDLEYEVKQGRMADPFHISDKELDKLYEEYLLTLNTK